jgi:hypothetical protein
MVTEDREGSAMSETPWPLVLPERWAWAPRTGAFISPEGVLYLVDLHINAILRDPGLFGFTSDYVEAIFRKHEERLWTEGEARAELIEEAVQRGWIRIRDYGNAGITVNVQTVDTRARQLLAQWAQAVTLLPDTAVDGYAAVRIRTASSSLVLTFQEVAGLTPDSDEGG